jgi:signal transduction histidine kinase
MPATAHTPRIGKRNRTGSGIAVALAGTALTAAVAVFVYRNAAPDDRLVVALAHALGVALPVALGLLRLRRRPADRLARVLVGSGLLFSVTALAESGDSTAFSAGRVAAWAFEPLLVYLILAFPYGRLVTRTERAVGVAAGLIAAVLYLPTALIAQSYPEPSPWSSCDTACPDNAFALGHTTPGVVDGLIVPVRETLTALVFAAVAVVVVRRVLQAGPMMRRTLSPVAAISVVRAVVMALYLGLRAQDVWGEGLEVLGFVYLFSLPAVALCFAAGIVNGRLFVADALQTLTANLRPHASAEELRSALSTALRDPSLQIVYWLNGEPGRWVDENGWPITLPETNNGRWVTHVELDRRRIAAIVHDVELSHDPALVQAATMYAFTALENERLIGQLSSSLEELSESRARIVAVADRERRKIERDLHDGAQQRLVALHIKLELIAERLDDSAPTSADAVRALELEVDATIDEVRSFARGVYPALLVDRGLSEALRAAGRSAPIPTVVDAARVGRYRPEIEATVYFACMEALQNAAKHAHGVGGVSIRLHDEHGLRFEVSDDGAGFDPSGNGAGAGLTNMRDRLAAVGGGLHVESAPGAGTRVVGVIPAAVPIPAVQ